ncbi:unnamed protein product [Alopecurus aequalis]
MCSPYSMCLCRMFFLLIAYKLLLFGYFLEVLHGSKFSPIDPKLYSYTQVRNPGGQKHSSRVCLTLHLTTDVEFSFLATKNLVKYYLKFMDDNLKNLLILPPYLLKGK